MDFRQENSFGINAKDARECEQQLVNMLARTKDGRMNQVSKITPSEAATLRILNYLGRTDITEKERFQFVSNCRFGDIMSMQVVMALMNGQVKGEADYE